ncbi:hypothetical protein B0H66DRAFT_613706 [Apodospora peruviana]|uniref:Uncharacterized protein n=1 Tax=Apodospora peruviana TaxID=516989 RepID=A0AAE0IUE0_9PEZI|nr:hypothetical protein B0H66DRAFT_613706 [Apodospora peruviana]
MPDSAKLNEIAKQAERDLNTHKSKTGKRVTGLGETGIDDTVEKKFPGAKVQSGEEFVSSRSMNRRIPPEEGGDVDERGRPYRGSAYENISGSGGPAKESGRLFEEPADASRPDFLSDENVRGGVSGSARTGETMEQGRLAAKSNRTGLEANMKHGHSAYRGADYQDPESVPDTRADQSAVPPGSEIETSRNI